MPAHNPKRCKVCAKRLERDNATGFCATHYAENRIAIHGVSDIAVIRGAFRDNAAPWTGERYMLSDIIAITARVFGASREAILSKSRKSKYIKPRNCIALLGKTFTNLAYTQIAAAMNRDHSTVLSRAAIGYCHLQTDQDFQSQVFAVVAAMQPLSPLTWAPHKPVVLANEKISEPEPEPVFEGEWDEVEALSWAVQQHYARRAA